MNKSTDLVNIPVSAASMLFNNSLSEGIFPKCLKTAKIIPISKSGDSNSNANYRPISMLCQKYLKNY